MQFSTAFRNGALDGAVAAIGSGLTLDLFSGKQPADVTAPDTGLLLASGSLPVDWLTPAQDGRRDLHAPRIIMLGARGGRLGYFRVRSGAATHIQGAIVEDPEAEGDMVVDTATVTPGQPVTVLSFALTAGGA